MPPPNYTCQRVGCPNEGILSIVMVNGWELEVRLCDKCEEAIYGNT